MTGGIIQLVAYGNQDIFLTSDPQITFFKIVYRRHTNFSMEVIPRTFINNPQFGNKVACILSRDGDLIRKVHLVIELPKIGPFLDSNQELDPITKFAWVRKIGFAIINTIQIEIGDELIDEQYGDWLNIWYELTVPYNQNIDKMIGNVEKLFSYTNGKDAYKLFIPLQFWFNRITGCALPIVSLQYNHIRFNLQLNEFSKCYTLAPTNYIIIDNDFVNFKQFEYIYQTIDGVTSYAQYIYYDILTKQLYYTRISPQPFVSVSSTVNFNIPQATNTLFNITGLTSHFTTLPAIGAVERVYSNPLINFDSITIPNAFLLIEYIFLDDEERIRFAQARHEYLVEQLFTTFQETINGLQQSYKIGFTQPCKELIWVAQMTTNITNNDAFNYTSNVIRNFDGTLMNGPIILNEAILFNGHERITFRDSAYFTQLQPYQYHKNNAKEGINVYSFGIHPENHQPSGTCNFSKVDNISLRINVITSITTTNTAKLRIYGIMYNILRIANGVSGLVFAIDYK
jgi:hypothetical protein